MANTGRKSSLDIQQQLRAATIARRVYSLRQVEALMEDFWTNHFYVNNQMFLTPTTTGHCGRGRWAASRTCC